uniref:Mtd_N domain-containing protein n=1 Tax=Panagrellus redivivus TaxID=6233 RepID=A0A7E4W3C9_PANRE
MFLTDRKKLMIIGNNKHGQLGVNTSRTALFRAANQTPNNVQRGPFNTAHLEFKTIHAIENESWAWTTNGVVYRCGADRDPALAKPVMTMVAGMKRPPRGARSV